MALSTYDPKEITVSVNGTILSGFTDTVVRVRRVENQVVDEVGADGEVTRIMTNDRRGEIEIELMAQSASNLTLSVLANADEQTGGGTFPILVQDNRGNDIHVAAEAWVQKQAEAVYDKTMSPRVWLLRCSDLRMVVAGHSPGAA